MHFQFYVSICKTMKKLLLLLALIPTLALAGNKSYVPGSGAGHYYGGKRRFVS
jgi:hypothetical protein